MTVTLRKLTPEEANEYFGSQSTIDLTEYLDALREIGPGEIAEIPASELSARATKRRFNLAARQLGKSLNWSNQSDNGSLYLRVVPGTVDEQTSEEATAAYLKFHEVVKDLDPD